MRWVLPDDVVTTLEGRRYIKRDTMLVFLNKELIDLGKIDFHKILQLFVNFEGFFCQNLLIVIRERRVSADWFVQKFNVKPLSQVAFILILLFIDD